LEFVITIICLYTSSCASIMSGSSQKIRIESNPTDAQVLIFDQDNMKIWDSSTPSTVSLKKGDGYFSGASYRIEITKDGYKKQQIQIDSQLNGGWYIAGNFLVGGLIGWLIVDPMTGGMWTLNPKNINLDLSKELGIKASEGSICIVLIEDIPDGILETLELVSVN